MSGHPIIFSGPMVLALLNGTKTQTRRIMKPQPQSGVRQSPFTKSGLEDRHGTPIKLRWHVGDRLYVRERCRAEERASDGVDGVVYRADGVFRSIQNTEAAADAWSSLLHYRCWPSDRKPKRCGNDVPAIHAPRWTSRITLTITEIRVQQLHELTEADAQAEGTGQAIDDMTYRTGFADFWSALNRKAAWPANPWVSALTFTVDPRNIDEATASA